MLGPSDEMPAVKAMQFYFEGLEKGFRGRPIVTILNKDINRTKSMKRDIPIANLKRIEDFVRMRSIA